MMKIGRGMGMCCGLILADRDSRAIRAGQVVVEIDLGYYFGNMF